MKTEHFSGLIELLRELRSLEDSEYDSLTVRCAVQILQGEGLSKRTAERCLSNWKHRGFYENVSTRLIETKEGMDILSRFDQDPLEALRYVTEKYSSGIIDNNGDFRKRGGMKIGTIAQLFKERRRLDSVLRSPLVIGSIRVYAEGRSQKEISELLGITQGGLSRMIGERSNGRSKAGKNKINN